MAGTLLNLPPGVFGLPGQDDTLVPLDGPAPLPALGAHDLIIQATRFPLDDDPEFDKNAVVRSGATLEHDIGAAMRSVFKYCSREAVILSDALAAACSEDARRFRAVQFSVRADNRTGRLAGVAVRAGRVDNVHHLTQCPKVTGPATFGYLVFIPKLSSNEPSPAFLNAFGLHGTGTVLWSVLLKYSLADRVRSIVQGHQPHLLVCRFQPQFDASTRPSYLTAATTGLREVVLDQAFDISLDSQPAR
jgi:hypothetical protein